MAALRPHPGHSRAFEILLKSAVLQIEQMAALRPYWVASDARRQFRKPILLICRIVAGREKENTADGGVLAAKPE
jgi:hypothetical protein